MMTDHREIADALAGLTIGKVMYNEPMALHTSLKMGGHADALILIENEEQLGDVVGRLRAREIPFLPVGNLSNVLVQDGGYRGALIWMRGLDRMVVSPPDADGRYLIDVQAGAALARLVGMAAASELTGLEFCTGIPGSLGGAIWMNAGAYGKEMKDVVGSVLLFSNRGEKKVLTRKEIAFTYRNSNLPADMIVSGARLVLQKGSGAQIQERMAEIMKMRREKHPLEYPSAGSVFRNLPGLAAGKLIEDLGLKGMRLGDVQVSKKHGNFIINKGRGTATDMLALIALVQEKAWNEKGVRLETEIVIIGEKA